MQDIRNASVERITRETQISLTLTVAPEEHNRPADQQAIDTGIPFFDHMLQLMATHGFMRLDVKAKGDLAVDHHHTVEDIGLVLGEALDQALGDRKGIRRYGHAVVPMDEALAAVTVDLSRRPYLVYRAPKTAGPDDRFGLRLAREFFRAVSVAGGLNLHVNIAYGENEHHMLEAVFKAFGRALDQAVALDSRVRGVCSTKGVL